MRSDKNNPSHDMQVAQNVPGIITKEELEAFAKMTKEEKQLKNSELYFRMLAK